MLNVGGKQRGKRNYVSERVMMVLTKCDIFPEPDHSCTHSFNCKKHDLKHNDYGDYARITPCSLLNDAKFMHIMIK